MASSQTHGPMWPTQSLGATLLRPALGISGRPMETGCQPGMERMQLWLSITSEPGSCSQMHEILLSATRLVGQGEENRHETNVQTQQLRFR